MLNATHLKRPELASRATAPSGHEINIDFYAIVRFLRRQTVTIAIVMSLTVLTGILYCMVATPKYAAAALVLVDNSGMRALRDQGVTSDLPSSIALDSQVEILKSERVLSRVVKQLNLAKDTEFTRPQGLLRRLLSSVRGLIGDDASAAIPPESIGDELIVDALRNNLDIRRVGFTNVIEVKYTSAEPEKASKVANAVANAYLAETLDVKYDVMRRAGVWLEERLKQLSQQTAASDTAVQDFKSKNNIVNTGRGLINEQQIAEVSSQIILARTQIAEAKARWERVEEILKSDPSNAAVTESLRNDVMVRLRQQYLEVSRRETELSSRYGAKHMAVIALQNEKSQLLGSIKDELKRIAQSYKSDYEIAKLREATLQQSLDALVAQTRTTNQAQVTLRELESSMQTSREVQDNFLKKSLEAAQQESFPVTEARIITSAKTPRDRSAPAIKRIVGGSAALGLFLGLIFALGRDAMDPTFRTPEQIREVLGCKMLGILPDLADARLPQRLMRTDTRDPDGAFLTSRVLGDELGSLRFAVNNPVSQFTETLRRVKLEIAADLMVEPGGKVIGFCSTNSGEGKTFVAANFANLLAHTGQRCVLVDCDLRYPFLTFVMSPDAKLGLVEVVNGTAGLEHVLWTDPQSKMSFLPAVGHAAVHHANEIMSSERMGALIERLRQRFDYVVLDLPPLVPFVDVRSVAQFVDAFVYIVKWGETRRHAAHAALESAPSVQEKLVGCLLNKADVTKLSRYQQNTETDYYHRYRAGYANRHHRA